MISKKTIEEIEFMIKNGNEGNALNTLAHYMRFSHTDIQHCVEMYKHTGIWPAIVDKMLENEHLTTDKKLPVSLREVSLNRLRVKICELSVVGGCVGRCVESVSCSMITTIKIF